MRWKVRGSFARAFGPALVLSLAAVLTSDSYALAVESVAHSYGGAGVDHARGLTSGADGHVYQAGWTSSTMGSRRDLFLIKWSDEDSIAWAKAWDFGTDEVLALCEVTQNDDVILAAVKNFGGRNDDILVMKINSGGSVLWARAWSRGWDDVDGLCLDPWGNILLSGISNSNACVWKFDPDGDLLWARTWNRNASHDGFYGQAVDAMGSVYLAGYSASIIGGQTDLFVMKLDADGDVLWGGQFWVGGKGYDEPRDVALGTDGSMYVVGNTSSYGAGDLDVLLFKVDRDGNFAWGRTWGGLKEDVGWSVIEAENGIVLAVGSTTLPGSHDRDVALVQFDRHGTFLLDSVWTTYGTDEARKVESSRTCGLLISGIAPNAMGNWQAVNGNVTVLDAGIVCEPAFLLPVEGVIDTLVPMEVVFDGVIDIGGGGSDALLLHFRPPPGVISLDIKPGSCPNPLNVKWKGSNQIASAGRDGSANLPGILPVAILGTVDFDVSDIDASTLALEGVAPLRWSFEDVATPLPDDAGECECTDAGPDGYMDLTLKFSRSQVASALGMVANGEEIPLTLTGNLLDGTPIEGTDCVIIRAKHNPITVTSGEGGLLPTSLVMNHPNPFNALTVVSYYLAEGGDVSLEVFDILGRHVTTLLEGHQEAGPHSVSWDGTDVQGRQVASGMYLYRLTAGTAVETRKMILMK